MTPGKLRRSQVSGTLSLQQSVAAAYEAGVPPSVSINTASSAAYGKSLMQPRGAPQTHKLIPKLSKSPKQRHRRHHNSTNTAAKLTQPAPQAPTQTQHHYFGMTNSEDEFHLAQVL